MTGHAKVTLPGCHGKKENLGNLGMQTIWFLQQITYKDKKKEGEGNLGLWETEEIYKLL